MIKKPLTPVKKAAAPAKGLPTNREQGLDDMTIVVLGKAKVGKTIFGLTASKDWPTKFPSPKWVKLTDMAVIGWDDRPLDGATEGKVEVVHLPARQWARETNMLEALRKVYDKIAECQAAGINIFMHDTASEMGRALVSYWMAKDEARDKRQTWGVIAQTHREIYERCKKVGGIHIFNFHLKSDVVDPDANAATTTRRAAAQMAGGGDYVMDLQGQGANIYKANCSMMLHMAAKPILGKKGAFERVIYTVPSLNTEGGTRFEDSLEDEEVPHLGKILDKIRKSMQ